jgi:hypothetical protein
VGVGIRRHSSFNLSRPGTAEKRAQSGVPPAVLAITTQNVMAVVFGDFNLLRAYR